MANYNEYSEHLTLPLLPLTGVVFAFPKVTTTINISDATTINAIEHSEKINTPLFAVTQKDPYADSFSLKNVAHVGVVVKIKQITRKNGDITVTVEGICRAKTINAFPVSGFYMADVKTIILENDISEAEERAYLNVIKEKTKASISLFSSPSKHLLRAIGEIDEIGHLVDFVGATVISIPEHRYALLCEFDELKRAELLLHLLEKEIQIVKYERNLKKKTSQSIEEHQKEYYLREQMKVIQNELGIDSQSDSEELYDQIIEAKLPKIVEEKLLKELNKFNKAPFGSPEAAVIRTYIETCLEVPFNKYSKDEISIKNARRILERDHYGLERVKERILEFIAVKEMNPDIKNQIICLVGPPGVGKTSLCASIAQALKRRYVRVSLGGVRDEADIRGHRKTYIGAMPGRIIKALCDCKVGNPVMVLDEIDKMTSDSRGDPASAMLEVLDSEQNKAFRDHFIELDVDLSHCMFIATANTLDSIPAPLIDRMEIIELSSYTRIEKLHIAKNHLIPKQLKLHGLNKRMLKIEDDAIFAIIDSYTAEAGVRNLERELASLCRKATKHILEKGVKTVKITASNISEFLGTLKYEPEKIDEENQVGVVNGLAYTSIGGDLLKIEASVMKGNGKLQLTGKLGEVMRESCEIAVSVIRENAERLGIDPDFYANNDIHIHVPEGAVPKDGPSAGITITTALVSILTGRAVKRDIAMTGEITLRGKVLPIGGLKEKTLAAYSAGVKSIIIPKKNEKDLADIEGIVRENVKFFPCENIFEVLDLALDHDEIIAVFSGCTGKVKNESKC